MLSADKAFKIGPLKIKQYVLPFLLTKTMLSVEIVYFQLTKLIPVTPVRRRWGTPIDASVATTAHRPLSSAMRSNDDNDWPVHSLMLFFHDLRDLPLRRLYHPLFLAVFGSVL